MAELFGAGGRECWICWNSGDERDQVEAGKYQYHCVCRGTADVEVAVFGIPASV
jgi:hypothetical protein